MLYVAGSASATPVEVSTDPSAMGNQRIVFLASPQGDGRVSWASGILPGLRVWYMPAEHGDLANYQPAFPGLLDLLQSGDTVRLAASPPAAGVLQSAGLPSDADALPRSETWSLLPSDLADASVSRRQSRKSMSPSRTEISDTPSML